jgi:nucleotidyltransferase AbiEii toxin of type IV toxin-antitoxin system
MPRLRRRYSVRWIWKISAWPVGLRWRGTSGTVFLRILTSSPSLPALSTRRGSKNSRKPLDALDPSPEPLQVGERTLHGSVGECRISFFEVEGSWLNPPLRVQEGIALAAVPELAAMKLVSVMTRCAKKDFYDLIAIARSGLSIREMVECGRRMYAGFDQALPHLRRALVYFEEAETDPDPITTVGMVWSSVKREMEMLARDLDRL